MYDIYTYVLLLYQGTWCLCLTWIGHYDNGVCNIRCDGNHAEKCGGPGDFVSLYRGMKLNLPCVHFTCTYDKRMQKQQQKYRNLHVSMNFYGMIVRIK